MPGRPVKGKGTFKSGRHFYNSVLTWIRNVAGHYTLYDSGEGSAVERIAEPETMNGSTGFAAGDECYAEDHRVADSE